MNYESGTCATTKYRNQPERLFEMNLNDFDAIFALAFTLFRRTFSVLFKM